MYENQSILLALLNLFEIWISHTIVCWKAFVNFKWVCSSTKMLQCYFYWTGGQSFFTFWIDILINILSAFTLAGSWSLSLLTLFCFAFSTLHASHSFIDHLVISHTNAFWEARVEFSFMLPNNSWALVVLTLILKSEPKVETSCVKNYWFTYDTKIIPSLVLILMSNLIVCSLFLSQIVILSPPRSHP